MRIGIGLPAAVPGVAGSDVGRWARLGEAQGFCSLGVIDRLVYDNLDPLIALAAAAERTERIELITAVINVAWRRNAVLLAKQLVSVDQVSGRRLTAGLAFGGWPEDYEASEAQLTNRGQLFDRMLASMQQVWRGEVSGASGPMPAQPAGRPRLLFGGLVSQSFKRAATIGEGWVAPSFGLEMLLKGVAATRELWERAGRPGRPRIVAERYFCLGDDADARAGHYLAHYYGQAYAGAVHQDTPTSVVAMERQLVQVRDADCDDLILLPCSADPHQVELLGDALDTIGITNDAVDGRRMR